MSQENVDVVRRAWDCWIAGDMDQLFTFFHPEVVWSTTNFEGWPEDDVYQGHDGVRRFFEQWRASWDRYEAGIHEIVDAGGDDVLVFCWQRGYGSGSQVPVEMDFGQATTVRDGLIQRMDAYSDPDAARAALGLPAG